MYCHAQEYVHGLDSLGHVRDEIHNPELDGLSKLLEALDRWLPRNVIVGGWAHRLYRYHPLAQAVQYEPLFTLQ